MLTYQDHVEAVRDKYADRIVKVLENIRQTIKAAGFEVSEPFEMSCDDYRWSMLVHRYSTPDGEVEEGDVDITFEIAESVQFEGTEDGINFSIDMVEVGGRILGGLTPHNYTSDVWVRLDDDAAIEARFSIFEQADAAEILALIEG